MNRKCLNIIAYNTFSNLKNHQIRNNNIVSLFAYHAHIEVMQQKKKIKIKNFLSRQRISSYPIIQRLLLSVCWSLRIPPPPIRDCKRSATTAPQPEPNKVTHLAFSCQ